MRPIRASSATRTSRPPRGAARSAGARPACEREATERADQRSLLVGEVDRLERHRQVEPCVAGRRGAPRARRRRRARRRSGLRCGRSRDASRAAASSPPGRGRGGSPSGWRPCRPSSRAPPPSARSWNQARAARCDSEKVVRSSPPSGVAPIFASASKSARRRSASTRSTIVGDATAAAAAPCLPSAGGHRHTVGTKPARIGVDCFVTLSSCSTTDDRKREHLSGRRICNAIRIASTGAPSRR